jgi:hypothetical protein
MKRLMSLHAVSSRALAANHLDLRILLAQGHFVLQGWMQYIRVTYRGRSGTHEPLAPRVFAPNQSQFRMILATTLPWQAHLKFLAWH